MKKLLKFLRSMKFGMALLLLVLACSFVGSIITQGQAEAYYLSTYPSWGDWLLKLGFDNIFASWYFITLIALLCVNLIFCSILRLGATKKTVRAMPLSAAKAETGGAPISEETLAAFLKARRFKRMKTDEGEIWRKNRAGHYGSFVVHLALLLLLLCGAAVLFLSVSEDVTVHVDETVALADGTELHLDTFRSTDAEGSVDYVSGIAVRASDGTVTTGEVSVNHPFSAAGYKLYQYNYGVDGQVTIAYNGQSETLCLTPEDEESFFSVDGENGLVYYGLYPDYILDENEQASLVTDVTNGYPNPIYALTLVKDGEKTFGLVLPGETLSAGDIFFSFGQPVDYSVIRVKAYPAGALALLYFSFSLLLIGLWLCFFQVPLYVKLDAKGYAVRSPKPAADFENSLKALTKKGTVETHA